MKREKFENLIKKAILSFPPSLLRKIENIAICIEDYPSFFQIKKRNKKRKDFLLGLYQGVPRTVWGRESFSARLPDKITIFQKPIENLAKSEKEIEKLVKKAIWHEIGHYFGFSEKEIKKLEKRWDKKIL